MSALKVGQVQSLELEKVNYLAVDGVGKPGGVEFTQAVELLYPTAYSIRGTRIKRGEAPFKVSPLEGLWWADDMNAFNTQKRDEWKWTLLLGLPELEDASSFNEILAEVASKRGGENWEKVHQTTLEEGLVAQTLHVGAYDNEGETVALLHDWVKAQGGKLTGKHHELYLSGRGVAPERQRTIIRQPYTL
jgi:hypothetical protein